MEQISELKKEAQKYLNSCELLISASYTDGKFEILRVLFKQI